MHISYLYPLKIISANRDVYSKMHVHLYMTVKEIKKSNERIASYLLARELLVSFRVASKTSALPFFCCPRTVFEYYFWLFGNWNQQTKFQFLLIVLTSVHTTGKFISSLTNSYVLNTRVEKVFVPWLESSLEEKPKIQERWRKQRINILQSFRKIHDDSKIK